ncbi:hypothetical protein [Nioella nitratireducens]|uniref:hypothetical protein n=1 Tax=Nioella nitratireducens TaxID=1287720 RepID=UPI0008FD1780|nr:hypothetical protein [Nioella nitratireducens]
MLKSLPKRVAALGLAATIAVTGVAASSSPARADNDNLLRFLGGAAAIAIIAGAVEANRNTRHHGHTYVPAQPPVTRYGYGYGYTPPPPPPVPVPLLPNRRLTLPGSCFNWFEGPNGRVRGFGAHCLYQHGNGYASLPNSCRDEVFTYHGWRDVYDAQCLYRHGYVRS